MCACKEPGSRATISHVSPTSTRRAGTQDQQFEQAVAEFGPALARLACAYEADFHRRQDLLQEIHIALWRSFATFDGRCSLRTWVYRVAHNIATAQVFRRRGRNPTAFLTLEDVETRAAAANIEETTDRERALERLLALTPVGVAIAEDPQCRVVRANAAKHRELGKSPDA